LERWSQRGVCPALEWVHNQDVCLPPANAKAFRKSALPRFGAFEVVLAVYKDHQRHWQEFVLFSKLDSQCFPRPAALRAQLDSLLRSATLQTKVAVCLQSFVRRHLAQLWHKHQLLLIRQRIAIRILQAAIRRHHSKPRAVLHVNPSRVQIRTQKLCNSHLCRLQGVVRRVLVHRSFVVTCLAILAEQKEKERHRADAAYMLGNAAVAALVRRTWKRRNAAACVVQACVRHVSARAWIVKEVEEEERRRRWIEACRWEASSLLTASLRATLTRLEYFGTLIKERETRHLHAANQILRLARMFMVRMQLLRVLQEREVAARVLQKAARRAGGC
jgi:hypothetical protein